ncbi:MAG: M48 family metalloprotease [Bryobacteraceae bacterium]
MKLYFAVLIAAPLLAQPMAPDPISKERALGKALAAEHRRMAPPVDLPAVQGYVSRIGGRLTSFLPELPHPYRFEVVRSDSAEPAALPGGYVLVPDSLLVAVQSEDELAGALAHAVSHIAGRFGVGSGPAGNLVFMGGHGGLHADVRNPSLTSVGFRSRRHEAEVEADRMGVRLAAEAGFDPAALRRYLDRVRPVAAGIEIREARLAALDEAVRGLPSVAPSAPEEFLWAQEALHSTRDKAQARPAPTLRRR